MRSVAEKVVRGQQQLEKLGNKNIERHVEHLDLEEFWEEIVQESKRALGLLWRRPLVINSSSTLESWNMGGTQREKMFAMPIALPTLALSTVNFLRHSVNKHR